MSNSSNQTTDTHEGIAELTTSERHSLLSAEQRRLVLDLLAGQTTLVELKELAAEVAARECETGIVDEKTIERTAITLHHTHLPKMADLGVLNYDPKSHQIDPDGALIGSIHHNCSK